MQRTDIGSRSLVYLDNAATTYPKPNKVIQAVKAGFTADGAAMGRSNLAAYSGHAFLNVLRTEILSYFGAQTQHFHVAFVPSATIGLNIVLGSLLRCGDHAVTTNAEHNAIYRTLEALKTRGVSYDIAECVDQDPVHILAAIEQMVKRSTRLVIINHASNVTGAVRDVSGIADRLHNRGINLVMDVSQSAGALDLSLPALGADAIIGSGHKHLYGPPGVGFIIFRKEMDLRPLFFGGTGHDSISMTQPVTMPGMLEAGTPNLPALMGLRAALMFCHPNWRRSAAKHERALVSHLVEQLSAMDAVQVFVPNCETRLGIVSFNVLGLDPSGVIAPYLAQHGVVVRAGLHCAPVIHKSLGTFPAGSIRVSVSAFTTRDDVERLLALLRRLF